MCTEPVPRTQIPDEGSERQDSQSSHPAPPRDPDLDDIENGYTHKEISEINTIPGSSLEELTFAHITHQIWHFSSVDHGPRCKSQYFLVLPQAKSE